MNIHSDVEEIVDTLGVSEHRAVGFVKVIPVDDFRQALTSYANSRIQEFVREVEGMKSKQKIDNGHDCYEHDCVYCENYIKDSTIDDIIALSQKYISKDKES